ncbi:MAG TPA: thiolase family protein [Verrucomicrobiales bacterium]|nr:thiolase family protein [Verrucomicrobiales bacterium]
MLLFAGVRTPFCKAGTHLAKLDAVDLGRAAVAALLARTGIDPGEISEVILGCVGQPVDAMNVARVIALRAGVPQHVPAATVHRNCASGMEALTTAAGRLATGHGDLFVAGGVESMSNLPFVFRQSAVEKFGKLHRARSLLTRARVLAAFRPADFTPRAGLLLGLTDPFSGLNMGETAEVLAREFDIGREEQDAFAAESHRRALTQAGALREEIEPIALGGKPVSQDNGPREDSTPEKLSRLRPVFDRKTGSVTAGNSSQITDGSVALLAGSEAAGKRLGLEPIGRLVGWAYTGCDPKRMGLGPVQAIAAANARTKLGIGDADVIEINEAFAAQVLAVLKALRDPEAGRRAGLDSPLGEIPLEKLNRRGGAIALGHPVGATGARLVLTALDQLRTTGGKRALVSLCVGGGQGAALWLERL